MLSRHHSRYLVWAVLALPAIAVALPLITSSGQRDEWSDTIHITGELSAWLLIAALLASPLNLVLNGWRVPRWLMRNRRYLGVASFGYAVFHTVLYLIDRAALARVVSDIATFEIGTGWVAFLLFVPLALTSSDRAVRQLGRHWKPLQRSVYPAAALTALHWASQDGWGGLAPAVLFFGPLLGLEFYRLWVWGGRPRRRI